MFAPIAGPVEVFLSRDTFLTLTELNSKHASVYSSFEERRIANVYAHISIPCIFTYRNVAIYYVTVSPTFFLNKRKDTFG